MVSIFLPISPPFCPQKVLKSRFEYPVCITNRASSENPSISLGLIRSIISLNSIGTLIYTIPESIGNMTSLKSLDVGGNPIRKLPNSIARLENLKSLYLKGVNQEFPNLRNDLKRLIIRRF